MDVVKTNPKTSYFDFFEALSCTGDFTLNKDLINYMADSTSKRLSEEFRCAEQDLKFRQNVLNMSEEALLNFTKDLEKCKQNLMYKNNLASSKAATEKTCKILTKNDWLKETKENMEQQQELMLRRILELKEDVNRAQGHLDFLTDISLKYKNKDQNSNQQ